MLNPTILTDYLEILRKNFKSEPLTDFATDTYYKVLIDWDDSEFVAVCELILENEKFFPKIPTFKEYYSSLFSKELQKILPILSQNPNIPLDSLNVPTAVKNALKSVPNWRKVIDGDESVTYQICLSLATTQKQLVAAHPVELVEGQVYWFGERQVRVIWIDSVGRATIQHLEENRSFLLNPTEFHKLTDHKNLEGQNIKLIPIPQRPNTRKLSKTSKNPLTPEELKIKLLNAYEWLDFLEKSGESTDRIINDIEELKQQINTLQTI